MAQCVGGLLGVLIVAGVLREAIAHSTVNYLVTLPGSGRTIPLIWLNDVNFDCL